MIDKKRPFAYLWIGLVLPMWLPACSADPEPPPPLDEITVRLLQEGEEALSNRAFDEALALADSAASRVPGAIQPHFLRGMVYSRTLRWEEAEAAYKEVVEREPAYRGVWNNLGNIAMRQDRLRDAVGFYRKELEKNPDITPWLSLGRAYRQLGIVDSAFYAFNQVLSLDSLTVDAHLEMAHILEEEGDFEQGLVYARTAYTLMPESPNTAYALGSLLARTEQEQEAINLLRYVTETWPWHTESHYALAQALQRVGEDEQSRQILEKAEELWQRQADVSYFQKTVSNDPSNPYNYAALATSFRIAGRYEEAIDAYTIALTLDENNLEFMNNLASLYFIQKDTVAAIQTYQDIIAMDESMLNAWLNLGVLYALSGYLQPAESAWQKVLELDPSHQQAQAYLARLYQNQ